MDLLTVDSNGSRVVTLAGSCEETAISDALDQYDVTVEELTEGSSYILPAPGDMRVPPPEPAAAPEPARPAATEVRPGELPSPLAGVVDAVEVGVGDAVAEGETLVVIDAMKMKTSIVASAAGRVAEILVESGQAVDAGQALVRIE